MRMTRGQSRQTVSGTYLPTEKLASIMEDPSNGSNPKPVVQHEFLLFQNVESNTNKKSHEKNTGQLTQRGNLQPAHLPPY